MLQVLSVVIQDGGSLDVQVFPSPLDLEAHGKVIGAIIKILAGGDKEAVRELLKNANRAAHDPQPLSLQKLH